MSSLSIYLYLTIPINDSRDSNLSTFTVLVVAAFTKKEKDKVTVAKQSHYLLLITVFVCESYMSARFV